MWSRARRDIFVWINGGYSTRQHLLMMTLIVIASFVLTNPVKIETTKQRKSKLPALTIEQFFHG